MPTSDPSDSPETGLAATAPAASPAADVAPADAPPDAPPDGGPELFGRTDDFNAVRRFLADRFLAGDGIEIGALHMPLAVPEGASVRYVDRSSVADLRTHYPELAAHDLTEIDIIDDGEALTSIADESLDFVIANHFIEHTQDPIGAIKAHLRVLRPDGVLYMAVPDKRFTFDVDRPVTPLAHLKWDHRLGPGRSRRRHFREWARLVSKVDAKRVRAEAAALAAQDYSIHFHVWTPPAFLELLMHCIDGLRLPIELEAFVRNEHEMITVMRKTAAAGRSDHARAG